VLRQLVPLAVPFVIGFAVSSVGISALETRDAGAASASVTWGGVVHGSPGDLGGWLAARGGSYETWAKNHPAAAARLEGRAQPPSSAEREPLLRRPSPTTDRMDAPLAFLGLLAGAALFTTVAVARRLARSRPRHGRGVPARLTAAYAVSGSDPVADGSRQGRVGSMSSEVQRLRAAAKSRAGALPDALARRRLDIVFWTAGITTSLLTGVLAAKLLA
jgi:hypothetical protein